MGGFGDVEVTWAARLGTLRNVVRQHLIRTQLQEHLDGVGTVLDVGRGQGTQAVHLAADGHRVTGVDPSADLLARAQAAAAARGCQLSTRQGTIDDLAGLFPHQTFDLVCAHGVLMYLPSAQAGFARLIAHVRPEGLLSLTVRNAEALAYRPGVRGDWTAALEAFDATTYVNELGVRASAHRLEEVLTWCRAHGLTVEAWYGVRVFTDPTEATAMPDERSLSQCLQAEEEAGRRDPYRQLASQLHVLARAST